MTVSAHVATQMASVARSGIITGRAAMRSTVRIQRILKVKVITFYMGIRASGLSKFNFCRHYKRCGLTMYELCVLYNAFQA